MSKVALQPHFTINDEDKAAEFIATFVEKTSKEEDCLFYEFFRSGDKLIVREAYTNGEGLLKHLANVGEDLGKFVAGPATLDLIQAFGPEEELAVVKEALAPLGAKHFVISAGFDNRA